MEIWTNFLLDIWTFVRNLEQLRDRVFLGRETFGAYLQRGPCSSLPYSRKSRGAMYHLTNRKDLRSTDSGTVQLRAHGDSEAIRRAISEAQAGSIDALDFLYICYTPEVLRYVRRLVHDDHEAEDIVQEVFMKLMSVIAKYEAREVPFGAWIRRVARNVAMDYLRTRRSIPCEEIRVRDDESVRISRERTSDLLKALAGLPKKQRDVLILRHVRGLTPVEIASILGKSEGSVHGLHHRGRVGLQLALEQLGAAPVVARAA